MVSPHVSQILCTLCLSLLAAAPASGAGFFAPTGGPDGRSAVDVAAAPNGSLYATTQPPSVYVLGSGSSRWARLPDPPVVYSRVEVAPNGRIWLFGFGSLLVSSDGGGSWETPGAVPVVTSLTFDATGRALAGTAEGVYRSADDGATWTLLALPAQPVSVIEVGSASLWVAIGTQLYRSDDQGTTWNAAATLPATGTALAEHPDGGVYAGIANLDPPACVDGGLYRITASGNVSSLGLEAFHIRDILVQSDDTVLASAGDPCWYYQACGDCGIPGFPDCGVSGVYRSTSAGASWTLATSAAGIPTQLVTRDDGTLYTAAQGTSCDICWSVLPGVLTSGDGGANWAPKNQGLGKSYVRWVAAPPNSGLVLAANSTSVYASSDRGANWMLFRDMTPNACAQVYGSIAFASVGSITFAVQDNGELNVHRVFPGSQSLVTPAPNGTGFRDMVATASGALVVAAGPIFVASSPISSGFTQIPTQLAPAGIGHLAAGPGNRLAGTTASKTYLSNDAGQFWTNIANVGNGRLAFSTDGFTLYVAQQGLNETTLWRLRESNNWLAEPVAAFASPPTAIHDLLVDPVGAVYVIAQFNHTGAGYIQRLSPGATTWQELDVLDYATGLALASDGYLYVSGQGVWRSASPVGTITDVGPRTQVVDAVSTAPNPLGESTSIRFRLAQADDVHLAVYDVRGRLVSTLLANRALESGPHDVMWHPPARTPNGVYVYRLHTSVGERRGRMLLLR